MMKEHEEKQALKHLVWVVEHIMSKSKNNQIARYKADRALLISYQEEEKRRVIEAANYALKSLKAAKADLDSAFRWGIVDIIGGMYIVSGIKLAKIESAKRHIQLAMVWLQQFRRENDQTDYANKKYMHLGIFGSLLDFGADGVVPDVYAQARIAGLRERVKEAIRRLEAIMKQAGIPKQ